MAGAREGRVATAYDGELSLEVVDAGDEVVVGGDCVSGYAGSLCCMVDICGGASAGEDGCGAIETRRGERTNTSRR